MVKDVCILCVRTHVFFRDLILEFAVFMYNIHNMYNVHKSYVYHTPREDLLKQPFMYNIHNISIYNNNNNKISLRTYTNLAQGGRNGGQI